MNLTKDAKWDPIRNDKRFWEDLPWMSDGKTLWNFIRPYKPDLLSAYTNRDTNCKPGKLKWASKNLGLGVNSSIFKEFENKTKHLNFIFSSGNDFIYEFFNNENYYFKLFSKKIFSKLNNNRLFNKIAVKYADRGLIF